MPVSTQLLILLILIVKLLAHLAHQAKQILEKMALLILVQIAIRRPLKQVLKQQQIIVQQELLLRIYKPTKWRKQ